MERRFNPRAEVRLTRADGKPPVITGYAARFYDGTDDTEYELYSEPGYRVVERLMPGTFTKAMNEGDPVALFNHDVDHVLGRRSAGTLRLAQDAQGLRYEIDTPDTQCARDLCTSIERGDIKGSSFAFRPRGTNIRRIENSDGSMLVIREISDVELFDVAPVTYPAYAGTSTGLRSAEMEEVKKEVEAFLAKEKRVALGPKLAAARARAVEVGA